ncbi:MAG: tetratricopeptide repeat protein [Balneolaceae bacterium]
MSDSTKNIQILAKNVQKDPTDLFSKFALALELLKKNDVDKARLLFESVLKQDSGYLGVYYHLGKLYQRLDMLDKAMQVFKDGVNQADKKNDPHSKSELLEAIEQLRYEFDTD